MNPIKIPLINHGLAHRWHATKGFWGFVSRVSINSEMEKEPHRAADAKRYRHLGAPGTYLNNLVPTGWSMV